MITSCIIIIRSISYIMAPMIINPYRFVAAESTFTVGEMTGSHTMNAEGGWKTYTTQNFGSEKQINAIQIVGTHGMPQTSVKNASWRILTTYNTQIGTTQTVPNGTSNGTSFDTGKMEFSEITAAGIKLQIAQETLYTPYPVVTVTCSTNTIWEA
jgi:hypothetical protein